MDRREFLACSAAPAFAWPWLRFQDKPPLFRLSLAEWSLHRELRSKQLDNLDFPKTAKALGIDAVEYVNTFFKDKARDEKYLKELRQRCADEEVTSLLIMCDGEGALGDPDEKRRLQAVTNHHRWVDAAKTLGCHAIRVNAQSRGERDEQKQLVADGLRRLTEYGAERDIAVIVENHGGLSSDAAWLVEVIELVDHGGCGTLPDFGNFRIRRGLDYDRYRGVTELMPYAKAVSAKSHDFDEDGNEIHTDFEKMMRIVLAAGYRGYVGIEYEGESLGEREGIKATKRLLERVHARLAKEKRAK